MPAQTVAAPAVDQPAKAKRAAEPAASRREKRRHCDEKQPVHRRYRLESDRDPGQCPANHCKWDSSAAAFFHRLEKRQLR